MARFLDGPAKGVTLELRRAPIMLRVVQDSTGNWDALDQQDDIPKPDEKIYLYMMVPDTSTRIHVQRRGVKDGVRQRCGWFEDADYKLFEPQPNEAEVRSTKDWNQWCDERQESLTELFIKIKLQKSAEREARERVT